MTAEPSTSFEALQAQANALTELFQARGHELVAPAYLQPADLFLDRMGEAIRSRTYVFTDHDGEELCLRPDVTLPACRLYLERYPQADVEARFCYNGPAFRYQPGGGDAMRPREFRQAGIEHFGGDDKAGVEAEVTGLIIEGVRAAGLSSFSIKSGDLALFDALVAALDIPERWRLRMQHVFWRPPVFRELLNSLSVAPAKMNCGGLDALVGELTVNDRQASEARVAAYLDEAGFPLEGTRSLGEITERLMDRAADAKEDPLPKETVTLIESYLDVSGPVASILDQIDAMTAKAGIDISDAMQATKTRYETFSNAGIDVDQFVFATEFGRDLEYYTGHVFQIELPGLGRAGHIAGGGRYDELLSSLGAPKPVPAVGSAIHTERLLAAVSGALQ